MALPTRVQRGQADSLELAQTQFDHWLNRFFDTRLADGGQYLAPYGVDIREDGDHFYVEAELPGYKKDEVDISMENQMLTITAEHKSQTDKKGDVLLHERRYSKFQRSFTLPPTVDNNSVQAKLADGVLTITLNKREETKPRKINVS